MMGYVNTRIAAMRAALMQRESVEELLEAPDERTFLDRLLSSPYGESLAEGLTDGSPRNALNRALLTHMSACFDRILAFTPSELKTDMDVLFEFLDVQAMKSILRGLHGKLPAELIRTGACSGSRLTASQIEILSEEADVMSAIAQLATWGHPFGAALRKPTADYRLDGDPMVLENALDSLRFDVPKGHPAADLIAMEAEVRNVMNALTSLGDERKPIIFNQGDRSTRLVTSLHHALSHNEAIALLAESHFSDVLDKALPMLLMGQSRFALLERLMDGVLIREVGRMALLDPESLAVPYHYILMKRNEVMNIRLIGIGLMDGLQRNAIRSALVFKEVA